MTKATPVKLYCNMHDTLINSNSRKVEQMENADIECVCCGRYYSGDSLYAFTLGHEGDSIPCNCFFGTIENGSHRKEEIESHHRGKTLAQVVADVEDCEREFNETTNENGCELHDGCDKPDCDGISITALEQKRIDAERRKAAA